MALSAFDDKARQPDDADLARTLKRSFALWNELKTLIAARFTPLSCEWGYAGKAYGWGLRLKHKKRTVLYMTPGEGHFLASFALGEKAVRRLITATCQLQFCSSSTARKSMLRAEEYDWK